MPSTYAPILLWVSVTALAYPPGSYEGCRAQLGAAGPFSFASDGTAVDVKGSLDSSAEDIQWNKHDVLKFTRVVNKEAKLSHLYEVDFTYNHAKPPRVVTVKIVTTTRGISTANGRLSDDVAKTKTYNFLNPDNTSECVLQEILTVKNDTEVLADDNDGMFDLEHCKAFLDFEAAHPDVPRCEALNVTGLGKVQFPLGYYAVEKAFTYEAKEGYGYEKVEGSNSLRILHKDGKGLFSEEQLAGLGKNYDFCIKHSAEFHDQYKLLRDMAGHCETRKDYVQQYFAAHQKLQASDVKFYPGTADPAR